MYDFLSKFISDADIRLVLNKVCKCGYFSALPDFNEISKGKF